MGLPAKTSWTTGLPAVAVVMTVGMLASPRMPAANSSSSSTSTTPSAPAAGAFLVRTAEPQRRAESLSVHESSKTLPAAFALSAAESGSQPSELLGACATSPAVGLLKSACLPSPITASCCGLAPALVRTSVDQPKADDSSAGWLPDSSLNVTPSTRSVVSSLAATEIARTALPGAPAALNSSPALPAAATTVTPASDALSAATASGSSAVVKSAPIDM